MPKFSVIIPVYSELSPQLEGNSGHLHFRAKMVQRAIKSIINQQFPDWELIIVNDGSPDPNIAGILQKFADADSRIRIITKANENRAIARNRGMEEATGEWICWLDCDDEYSTHYLREVHQASLDFPEYQMFNFGSLVYWSDHRTTLRQVFVPDVMGDGHVWFRSGEIGTGSFVFKRELWLTRGTKLVRHVDDEENVTIEKEECQIYRIPDEVNPYNFAAASLFDLRLDPITDKFHYDNTENPDGAFTDGVRRHGLSLGNPWGDDFVQFYLLTRDHQSKPLDMLLYIQYPRSDEDDTYEYYGAIYDTD
jgi:glycosyltransferase involved in cell wall biosynthesis